MPAGDDLHRRTYLRQQVAQDGELRRVAADVAHRLDEAVALVGGEVVLADPVRKRVPLDAAQRPSDDLARVSGAVALEIGSFDPLLQPASQLQRDRRPSAAHDEAAQTPGTQRRGEEQRRGADVGTDGVRVLEPERVGRTDHELAHRPGGEQRVATFGVAEPRQIDRHQVRVFGESRPDRLEGEQALRPGTQQQGVVAPGLALGEAHGQPVDRPESRLDGCVRPQHHGECDPGGLRSHPPVDSPGGSGAASRGRRASARSTRRGRARCAS